MIITLNSVKIRRQQSFQSLHHQNQPLDIKNINIQSHILL